MSSEEGDLEAEAVEVRKLTRVLLVTLDASTQWESERTWDRQMVILQCLVGQVLAAVVN